MHWRNAKANPLPTLFASSNLWMLLTCLQPPSWSVNPDPAKWVAAFPQFASRCDVRDDDRYRLGGERYRLSYVAPLRRPHPRGCRWLFGANLSRQPHSGFAFGARHRVWTHCGYLHLQKILRRKQMKKSSRFRFQMVYFMVSSVSILHERKN